MKTFLKILLPLLVLTGAIGGFVYLKKTKAEIKPKPVVERSWPVAAVAAEKASLRPTIRVFGEVVSGRDTDLRPLVAGRIVEVNPKLVDGGMVEEGDLLVAIDAFDYETELRDKKARLTEAGARMTELLAEREGETAQMRQDQRQLSLNRTEAKRRERLLKTGAGTQKSLDDARLSLSASEQQVAGRRQRIKTVEARLTQARSAFDQAQVALERAERDLADTRLTAPYDGILTDVDAAIGKQVSTNDAVARLTAVDNLEARFLLSGDQYARLMADGGPVGRAAQVVWGVGESDYLFNGRISRAEGRIDAAAGGVRLYASLIGTGLDSPLRPGAFVEVLLPDRGYENVVSLPPAAVHDAESGGKQVYVTTDSRLQPVDVRVVGRDGARLLIDGGFETGARIVVTRFPEMGPGVKVEVK